MRTLAPLPRTILSQRGEVLIGEGREEGGVVGGSRTSMRGWTACGKQHPRGQRMGPDSKGFTDVAEPAGLAESAELAECVF